MNYVHLMHLDLSQNFALNMEIYSFIIQTSLKESFNRSTSVYLSVHIYIYECAIYIKSSIFIKINTEIYILKIKNDIQLRVTFESNTNEIRLSKLY